MAALWDQGIAGFGATFRYDPYGELISSPPGGSTRTPWRYQGRMLEGEASDAELYDFGFRSYAADLGAFASLDSVPGGATDVLSLNRFLYANANRTTLIDPDGHAALPGCNTAKYDGCNAASIKYHDEPEAKTQASNSVPRRAKTVRTTRVDTLSRPAGPAYRIRPANRTSIAFAEIAWIHEHLWTDVSTTESDDDVLARVRMVQTEIKRLRSVDPAVSERLQTLAFYEIPLGLHLPAERRFDVRDGESVFIAFSIVGLGRERVDSNRALPRNKHGEPLPDVDAPHTQIGTRDTPYGPYRQARQWETNPRTGRLEPTRDVPWSDHGLPAGHPSPHQHRLQPNPNRAPKGGYGRDPAEPLEPGWTKWGP